jgi:hypothetical protein
LADDLVLQWGYKLPAWKAKLRAGEQGTERVRDDGDQLALRLAGS